MSMPRRLATLLPAIVLAVAAAGCSSPSPSPSVAPTQSGAPEASDSGSPGVGLDFQLAALTERIRAGLRQQGEFVTRLATASIESPVPSGAVPMSIVALAMTNWAGSERQWLADHPPEACYATVQARYAEAVDAIAASAAAFAKLGGSVPGPSGDGGASAVTALTGARTTIEDANSMATAAAAACSTAP